MQLQGKVLVVVAHPDDETLGCGGRMAQMPDCVIVHATDGAPLDNADGQRQGFASRDQYARARRRELDCALSIVGGRERRELGIVDQQAWRDLYSLTLSVESLIEEVAPGAVFTHPYEGGHPDHDSLAFAVQHACARLGSRAPERVEMAFYHRADGRFVAGEFLPGPKPFAEVLEASEREQKQRMLGCFVSQQEILHLFDPAWERWRIAPTYDFTNSPHEGPLNYETFGWPITGALWREAAANALTKITR